MTVPHVVSDAVLDLAEPLTVEAAYARSQQAALTESVIGPVGLELETHLVDLDAVAEAVPWPRVDRMLELVRKEARTSAVTVEPGGQLELSGRPAADVSSAVRELRADRARAAEALAGLRLGVVPLGADPLRPSRRVNPRPRYQAMERHFAATGRGEPGAQMMNSTAALQVNLEAGPRLHWPERVARAHRLGPTMVAISASSPWLSGRPTGWKSARQRAWAGLDPRACGPVPGCVAGNPDQDGALDPAAAWAQYALRAPVSFVRVREGDAMPVCSSISFEDWASGRVRLAGRSPTAADLDIHLTTLFPPVRLKGYLELRYLDMNTPRWWPAVAAVVTALMDDPVAADLATEATERTTGRWAEAARCGLTDAALAQSARRCLAIAASRVPAELSSAVADLAELIDSGRSPGDLLADRITEIGPHAAFEELAHA
jgi:glutamate--cysteine ligase